MEAKKSFYRTSIPPEARPTPPNVEWSLPLIPLLIVLSHAYTDHHYESLCYGMPTEQLESEPHSSRAQGYGIQLSWFPFCSFHVM
jgi:hypothetical protein